MPQWTDDLATGSDLIDGQHKELFRRINALHDACKQKKGKSEVQKTLNFLNDYVLTHFSAEEEIMRRYQYPDFGSHKAQHLEFMSTLSSLNDELEAAGPGLLVVVKTNDMMAHWLVNHILKLDKAFGSFLRKKPGNAH